MKNMNTQYFKIIIPFYHPPSLTHPARWTSPQPQDRTCRISYNCIPYRPFFPCQKPQLTTYWAKVSNFLAFVCLLSKSNSSILVEWDHWCSLSWLFYGEWSQSRNLKAANSVKDSYGGDEMGSILSHSQQQVFVKERVKREAVDGFAFIMFIKDLFLKVFKGLLWWILANILIKALLINNFTTDCKSI